MKLHSDILYSQAVRNAAREAGRQVKADVSGSGSRKRDHAFKVLLTGTSTRWANSGKFGAGGEHSATWDEWGMFINIVFEMDPDAIVGTYKSYEHFRAVTCNRFDSLTAPYAHGDHKWGPTKDLGKFQCQDCEAEFNSTAA